MIRTGLPVFGCEGKVKHRTAADAYKRLKQQHEHNRLRDKNMNGKKLKVYKCPHCKNWHVGKDRK